MFLAARTVINGRIRDNSLIRPKLIGLFDEVTGFQLFVKEFYIVTYSTVWLNKLYVPLKKLDQICTLCIIADAGSVRKL